MFHFFLKSIEKEPAKVNMIDPIPARAVSVKVCRKLWKLDGVKLKKRDKMGLKRIKGLRGEP